jgi:hypothetical protein
VTTEGRAEALSAEEREALEAAIAEEYHRSIGGCLHVGTGEHEVKACEAWGRQLGGLAGTAVERILAARLAEVEAQAAKDRALIRRVLTEKRIRHDHAYPMELGPHHCDGCDLIDDLRAAVAAADAGGQP